MLGNFSGDCLFGCLVSYLAACWMVAWLVGSMLDGFKKPVTSWQYGKLLGWLVDCMIGWFVLGLGLVRVFSAGS